jgi:hypothetical protein
MPSSQSRRASKRRVASPSLHELRQKAAHAKFQREPGGGTLCGLSRGLLDASEWRSMPQSAPALPVTAKIRVASTSVSGRHGAAGRSGRTDPQAVSPGPVYPQDSTDGQVHADL